MPGPERVAMLCQGTENYGIGTILKLYATSFPQLTFVALSDGALVHWLKQHGIKISVVPGLAKFYDGGPSLWTLARLPYAMARAKRDAARIDAFLRHDNIRIVHAHWRPQQLIAGFLRRRGYYSVWQINNNMNPNRLLGLGVRLNHRLAAWGADLLLPASDFIASNWRGCGVAMTTVRNAAIPIFSASNQLAAKPIRCIVAGRLEHEKGHHIAVEAVIRARTAGNDVELDIFGGPLEHNPYAVQLKRRVEEAGCSNAIRFCGFRQDMRSQHQQYHLGFQCRVNPEPCSLWVCETLVDGLPLIASATGGTPELIEDGETGLLVRPGDVDDLTTKLIELASNPQRLNNMRTKAFERGQRLFTVDRYARETLSAYACLAGFRENEPAPQRRRI